MKSKKEKPLDVESAPGKRIFRNAIFIEPFFFENYNIFEENCEKAFLLGMGKMHDHFLGKGGILRP